MVAASLALVAVHALLNYSPMAVPTDEEPMKIQIETVLNRGAVNLGNQPAGAHEILSVNSYAVAQHVQFIRRSAGMTTAATANIDPKFVANGLEAAFQSTDDARCDARGMPVHAHDCAKGLEPKRVRQPTKKFIATIVLNDRLTDYGAQRGHARRQPWRYTPVVEGKVSAAAAACH